MCTLGRISTKQTCRGARGCKGLSRGVNQVGNTEQQSSLSMDTWELPAFLWLYSFHNNTTEKYLQAQQPAAIHNPPTFSENCNETWIRQEWGELLQKKQPFLSCMQDPSQKTRTNTTLLRMMFSRSDSQSTTTSLSFFFSSSWKSTR